MGINELHLDHTNTLITLRSKCNTADTPIVNNNFIFSDTHDKLNIIGAFYESVNSPRYLNNNTRIKQLVDTTAADLKAAFTTARDLNNTKTQFSHSNRASDPKPSDGPIHPFCNPQSIEYILKSLPNKTSSGLDNIPPIALKHLTKKMIRNLAILFNNALNHKYFPEAWKKAKVLPILKKNKNPHDPSSYRPISLTPSLSKVLRRF